MAILSLVTLKFRYPHPFDLGELLSDGRDEADVLAPEDALVAAWNAGRGVRYLPVPKKSARAFQHPFQILRALLAVRYDVVVATCPKSLGYALLSRLIARHRTVYYGFEFSLPNEQRSRSAWFNYLTRLVAVPIYQTGPERARMFARVYRPKRAPDSVHCAALGHTKALPVSTSPTLEASFIERFGSRPKLLIAVNGGIGTPDLGAIGNLLDAGFSKNDDVGVVMLGPLDNVWRQRIAAHQSRGGQYLHVGAIEGTRYDLARVMQGCDLGWAFKRNDRCGTINDRTYTPNKLYDYLRAGMGTLIGSQRSLRFAVRGGFAMSVGSGTAEDIRKAGLFLVANPAAVEQLKVCARAAFATTLNYEFCSQQLRQQILGKQEDNDPR